MGEHCSTDTSAVHTVQYSIVRTVLGQMANYMVVVALLSMVAVVSCLGAGPSVTREGVEDHSRDWTSLWRRRRKRRVVSTFLSREAVSTTTGAGLAAMVTLDSTTSSNGDPS